MHLLLVLAPSSCEAEWSFIILEGVSVQHNYAETYEQ